MPTNFDELSSKLLDKGMGTENVGHLLYALVKMIRPETCMAIGLGYSTLFILKALSENHEDTQYDLSVLNGNISDTARKGVLYQQHFDELEDTHTLPLLHGVDNFSEAGSHTNELEAYISELGYQEFFTLHNCDFRKLDTANIAATGGVEFIWLDCGHQLDYPDLINTFWPLLSENGGIMIIHYTAVDIDIEDENERVKLVISGATANAIKKQQLQQGISARFEFMSIVEPHKFRQGSVSVLRKLGDGEVCRDTNLQNEMSSLYGQPGNALTNLNQS